MLYSTENTIGNDFNTLNVDIYLVYNSLCYYASIYFTFEGFLFT